MLNKQIAAELGASEPLSNASQPSDEKDAGEIVT